MKITNYEQLYRYNAIFAKGKKAHLSDSQILVHLHNHIEDLQISMQELKSKQLLTLPDNGEGI